GAVSTMALSVVAPVVRHEFFFSGPNGDVAAPVSPAQPTDPVRSLGVAIDQLLDQIATGRRDHPVDVHFARDVTRVLEAAHRTRETGTRTQVCPPHRAPIMKCRGWLRSLGPLSPLLGLGLGTRRRTWLRRR